MGRVTLQTIAEATGLSKFAVSRALAGKSGVSEETRARVAAIAAQLGYKRPMGDPKPLGVVFSANDLVNSELQMQIQSGVQREAQRLGHGVRVHWVHAGEDIEALARACAGLMICGPHDPRALAGAYATGLPIVRQGWLEPLEPVDLIGGTDHEGGAAVATYLLALGHREIAYAHGDPRYRGRMERLNGLREVLARVEGAVAHDLTWEDDESFPQVFERLLARGGNPTAYFCAHDGIALTVISELLSRGIRIPEDASVVGFGDFSAALQILPRLTTVKVPGTIIGATAVWLLDARIKSSDHPAFPLRVLVPSQVVERQSAGPVHPARRPASYAETR